MGSGGDVGTMAPGGWPDHTSGTLVGPGAWMVRSGHVVRGNGALREGLVVRPGPEGLSHGRASRERNALEKWKEMRS